MINVNNSDGASSANSSLSITNSRKYRLKFVTLLQNIRSLRSNFHALVAHINSLNHFLDLIFLTEISIYDSEIKDYSMPDYNLYGCCNNSYASGGVAVFVKSIYTCT